VITGVLTGQITRDDIGLPAYNNRCELPNCFAIDGAYFGPRDVEDRKPDKLKLQDQLLAKKQDKLFADIEAARKGTAPCGGNFIVMFEDSHTIPPQILDSIASYFKTGEKAKRYKGGIFIFTSNLGKDTINGKFKHMINQGKTRTDIIRNYAEFQNHIETEIQKSSTSNTLYRGHLVKILPFFPLGMKEAHKCVEAQLIHIRDSSYVSDRRRQSCATPTGDEAVWQKHMPAWALKYSQKTCVEGSGWKVLRKFKSLEWSPDVVTQLASTMATSDHHGTYQYLETGCASVTDIVDKVQSILRKGQLVKRDKKGPNNRVKKLKRKHPDIADYEQVPELKDELQTWSEMLCKGGWRYWFGRCWTPLENIEVTRARYEHFDKHACLTVDNTDPGYVMYKLLDSKQCPPLGTYHDEL
jgi:hypothetical protein